MRSPSDARALVLALLLLAPGCKEEKKEAPLVITTPTSESPSRASESASADDTPAPRASTSAHPRAVRPPTAASGNPAASGSPAASASTKKEGPGEDATDRARKVPSTL
jgi:hypothetical protein